MQDGKSEKGSVSGLQWNASWALRAVLRRCLRKLESIYGEFQDIMVIEFADIVIEFSTKSEIS